MVHTLAVAFLSAISASEAFITTSQRHHYVEPFLVTVRGKSALSALPPTLIISPMIKKFREDQAKKNQPMISADEAKTEAPGLRVGKNVWKWPPIWPYDASFFTPVSQLEEAQSQAQIKNMASMLSGVAQAPGSTEVESEAIPKFDGLKYWGEEKATTETGMDPEAAEKLTQHYSYYLEDGMSILEFGAAENSYLPENFKPSRHVGVGGCQTLMDKNPSLTESLVVDLNKVVPDRDVDSDDLRVLSKDPFDVVIMANTVPFLTDPREVFRSAWYLLKPGGKMIVSFGSKDTVAADFSDAMTRMWRDYNDDQHTWITGSFFQFSAGEGWETLLGFDISPESAKMLDSGPMSMLSPGKANNVFVVQATKGSQDECIDPNNTERSIGSLCWMLPVLEDRDKKLVVPRLARAYDITESKQVKAAIERNIGTLPTIYESLTKMDQFSFTFSMQSQLAADLVCDPDFTGSEEQILALKQGLGLRTPSPDFWLPVGQNTAAMEAEDKINLLAYLVPSFGSNDSAQEKSLQAFVTGLKPTFAVIRSKCPDLSEADVQLLGTELLAAEVSKVRRSSRMQFATWINALTEDELRELLSTRKLFRVRAMDAKADFVEARKEENARVEEYKRKMEEQISKAREERALYFNPSSEKMEIYDNPNMKKGGIFGMFGQ